MERVVGALSVVIEKNAPRRFFTKKNTLILVCVTPEPRKLRYAYLCHHLIRQCARECGPNIAACIGCRDVSITLFPSGRRATQYACRYTIGDAMAIVVSGR